MCAEVLLGTIWQRQLLRAVGLGVEELRGVLAPEGNLNRWTAPRKKFIQRTRKINGNSRSLVERLIDFKIYALSVLGSLGSISAPDGATLREEAHAQQCITAGPYNAFPTDLYYVLDLRAVLVSTYLGSVTAMQKSGQLENTTVSSSSPLTPNGKNKV